MTGDQSIPMTSEAPRTWTERPMPQLRWLRPPYATTLAPKLQQLHEVREYGEDGKVKEVRLQWRDVPTQVES